MRVLHVLAERGYSGGEVQLHALVEHLQRRGHSNHLMLVPGAKFGEVGRALGVPVFELQLRRAWRPGTGRAFANVVSEVQPHVLHFGCGRSLLWGGLFARKLGVPLRLTTRRIDYPIGRSFYRGGRYRRLVDHVVANCLAVQRQVEAAGVPPERVSLIHEGIAMEPWDGIAARRDAAREALGLAPDDVVVSCPATLRPRKGQRLLIRAFARIAALLPASRLVLAGTGPDAAALARRAEQAGLADRVLLPGAVKPVADLYAASDVVCMPSFNEGLSNACLEASAAGLPLVVSEAGGLPEIVADGETGAVVPIGDVDALARALGEYLADGELRARAGAAGAVRTRRLFRVEQMTAKMEALMVRLLAAAGVPCSTT